MLANPKNDAIDVSAALKILSFQVIEGIDLDKAAFDRKLREFASALQGAEVGLFFFAGHGLQVGGQNYLVPIDAELKSPSALDFEMVRMDVVQRVMEHETSTNVLFLDACRDNPLARNLARAMGTRSSDIGRGLAPVVSGVGTLISFSTQPGNVALDGRGRNSPFAGALVRKLAAPKDDLSSLLIDVRNDVMQETQNKQVPWEHSALRGRFFFQEDRSSKPAAVAAPPLHSPAGEAERVWTTIKDTKNAPMLEAYIRRFGDTFYGELDRERLKEVKQEAAKPPTKTAAAPVLVPPKAEDARAPGSSNTGLGGRWRWSANCGNNGNWGGAFQIQQAGGSNFSGAFAQTQFGDEGVISDGTVQGDRISFNRRAYDPLGRVQRWSGRLVGGARMSGSITDPLGSCTFSATKQ